MTDNQDRQLVKIVYIIPETEEDAGLAEGLWAYPLGNQLYQLQNIPVYAEHLNVEDIVRCEEPPDARPVIQEVVEWSGNRTLRVIFQDEAPDETCVDIIWELAQHGIQYEKPVFKRYMFNVTPHQDYNWVRDFLQTKEEEGLLWLFEQTELSSSNE